MDSFEEMLRLILLCVLLQRVASNLENGHKDLNNIPEIATQNKLSYQDKIISTFQTLFTRRSLVNETHKPSDGSKETLDKEHLDSILSGVTDALDQIKDELLKLNKDGFLEIEIPEVKHTRYRRDVSNETIDTTTVENDVTENNVTTTEAPETVTETVITAKTTQNEEISSDDVTETNVTESPDSSRRMLVTSFSASTKIKEKLLSYLEDTFNEVEMKIKPLTGVKVALSSDVNYTSCCFASSSNSRT